MFVRGDVVIIYGGYIDSAEKRTTVEIGTVVEAGRYELLVTLENRSWGGPSKVPITICEKIEGKFEGIKSIPNPEVGDLVLISKYDVVKSSSVNKVGTVQALEMNGKGCQAHVLIDGEIKKIALEDCMVL